MLSLRLKLQARLYFLKTHPNNLTEMDSFSSFFFISWCKEISSMGLAQINRICLEHLFRKYKDLFFWDAKSLDIINCSWSNIVENTVINPLRYNVAFFMFIPSSQVRNILGIQNIIPHIQL